MTKDSEKTFGPLLTGLGFSSESHQTWTLWRFAGRNADAPRETGKTRKLSKASSRLVNPWRVGDLELAERRTGLTLHKFSVSLNKETLLANLAAATKKYFGPRASADFVFGNGGELRADGPRIVEVVGTAERVVPYGQNLAQKGLIAEEASGVDCRGSSRDRLVHRASHCVQPSEPSE